MSQLEQFEPIGQFLKSNAGSDVLSRGRLPHYPDHELPEGTTQTRDGTKATFYQRSSTLRRGPKEVGS